MSLPIKAPSRFKFFLSLLLLLISATLILARWKATGSASANASIQNEERPAAQLEKVASFQPMIRWLAATFC